MAATSSAELNASSAILLAASRITARASNRRRAETGATVADNERHHDARRSAPRGARGRAGDSANGIGNGHSQYIGYEYYDGPLNEKRRLTEDFWLVLGVPRSTAASATNTHADPIAPFAAAMNEADDQHGLRGEDVSQVVVLTAQCMRGSQKKIQYAVALRRSDRRQRIVEALHGLNAHGMLPPGHTVSDLGQFTAFGKPDNEAQRAVDTILPLVTAALGQLGRERVLTGTVTAASAFTRKIETLLSQPAPRRAHRQSVAPPVSTALVSHDRDQGPASSAVRPVLFTAVTVTDVDAREAGANVVWSKSGASADWRHCFPGVLNTLVGSKRMHPMSLQTVQLILREQDVANGNVGDNAGTSVSSGTGWHGAILVLKRILGEDHVFSTTAWSTAPRHGTESAPSHLQPHRRWRLSGALAHAITDNRAHLAAEARDNVDRMLIVYQSTPSDGFRGDPDRQTGHYVGAVRQPGSAVWFIVDTMGDPRPRRKTTQELEEWVNQLRGNPTEREPATADVGVAMRQYKDTHFQRMRDVVRDVKRRHQPANGNGTDGETDAVTIDDSDSDDARTSDAETRGATPPRPVPSTPEHALNTPVEAPHSVAEVAPTRSATTPSSCNPFRQLHAPAEGPGDAPRPTPDAGARASSPSIAADPATPLTRNGVDTALEEADTPVASPMQQGSCEAGWQRTRRGERASTPHASIPMQPPPGLDGVPRNDGPTHTPASSSAPTTTPLAAATTPPRSGASLPSTAASPNYSTSPSGLLAGHSGNSGMHTAESEANEQESLAVSTGSATRPSPGLDGVPGNDGSAHAPVPSPSWPLMHLAATSTSLRSGASAPIPAASPNYSTSPSGLLAGHSGNLGMRTIETEANEQGSSVAQTGTGTSPHAAARETPQTGGDPDRDAITAASSARVQLGTSDQPPANTAATLAPSGAAAVAPVGRSSPVPRSSTATVGRLGDGSSASPVAPAPPSPLDLVAAVLRQAQPRTLTAATAAEGKAADEATTRARRSLPPCVAARAYGARSPATRKRPRARAAVRCKGRPKTRVPEAPAALPAPRTRTMSPGPPTPLTRRAPSVPPAVASATPHATATRHAP